MITTKTFRKIGIVQIFIGLGIVAYGLYTNNLYSLIHITIGILMIMSSVLYYFDD